MNDAYLTLTEQQKIVLNEEIKRGKKTKWLNLWAKKKGSVLTTEDLENPDMTMNKLLDWVLIDIEDSLTVSPATKCDCGRPLRYRYTIFHKSTGKIYKLGSVHFAQHTGLSPDLVREITIGLKVIDLERDEILTKVIDKWETPFPIPAEIKVPGDMSEQIRVKLPLLNRQIEHLKKLIFEYKLVLIKNQKSQKHTLKKNNNLIQQSFFNIDLNNTKQINIKEEKINIGDSENIDPMDLYSKLKEKNISTQESKMFYEFISNHKSELKNYGLDLSEIKEYVTKALGKISNPNIRQWLVEIEFIND